MYNKQAFQSDFKSGCGSMGRGKFGGPWGRGKFEGFRGRHGWGAAQVPVNIGETDASYIISLFAAGLSKETIQLAVKDDVLTISYQGINPQERAETGTETSYTYQEHRQESFERSFRLNNKVLTESISATYTDGVLRVTMPKNPATNVPAQTITVA